MRFEKLSQLEQKEVLVNLHHLLNEQLFNNELKTINISLENLDNAMYQIDDAFAVFFSHDFIFNSEMKMVRGERIIFSYEFCDAIAAYKTQREQRYLLVQVMLHEMIHQYCYETGLDDGDHNENFMREAEKHGLVCVYEAGKKISEELGVKGIVFMNLCFNKF